MCIGLFMVHCMATSVSLLSEQCQIYLSSKLCEMVEYKSKFYMKITVVIVVIYNSISYLLIDPVKVPTKIFIVHVYIKIHVNGYIP